MKGWEVVSEIKVLLDQGASISQVARKLKIDRKTVRKYKRLSMSEIAEQRRLRKRGEPCIHGFEKMLEARIQAMKEDGLLNAQAIYEDLKQAGYEGSARSIRRYVARKREGPKKRRVYQPFETRPGVQAMVDFGEKRKVWMGGRRVVLHFAVMVLSYSRKKYVEWYDRPLDTEMFLNFHQRAFAAFGGIPHEIVYDQTKLAVLGEAYGEVSFNEGFYSFARWCGFRSYICRKRDPQTKGKVEAVVKYVKRSFLVGRRLESFSDLEEQWSHWLARVGDAKRHETTGRIPVEAWREEQPYLQPLREGGYPCKPAFKTHYVHRDGLVKVLGNRYSVPCTYQGQAVKVRVTEERVEVYNREGERICSHWRCLEKGKCFKLKAHYQKVYRIPTQALSAEVLRIFANQAMLDQLKYRFPRHYREQCQRLMALERDFPLEVLRRAAARMVAFECVSYQNVKKTANALEAGVAVVSMPRLAVSPQIHLPLDLGLEDRSLAYYDGIGEVP